jgi:hypothetical protein
MHLRDTPVFAPKSGLHPLALALNWAAVPSAAEAEPNQGMPVSTLLAELQGCMVNGREGMPTTSMEKPRMMRWWAMHCSGKIQRKDMFE